MPGFAQPVKDARRKIRYPLSSRSAQSLGGWWRGGEAEGALTYSPGWEGGNQAALWNQPSSWKMEESFSWLVPQHLPPNTTAPHNIYSHNSPEILNSSHPQHLRPCSKHFDSSHQSFLPTA